MTAAEMLLIVLALSFNVFLVAESEGSNLKILNRNKTAVICLIFLLGQSISMTLGYLVTRLPFLRPAVNGRIHMASCVRACVIFMLIGAYMFYKAARREHLEEHLQELRFRRIALEAVTVAAFTFLGGIGCGFMNLDLLVGFIMTFLITIAAVVGGLYAGYYFGNHFRRVGFGLGSAFLVFTGVEILMRFIN